MTVLDPQQLRVKVETFYREGVGQGVRISFLYNDRGPEIFEKAGFPTEMVALQFGKDMVKATVESIPGADCKEQPCSI